jgi:hypothetical protein
MASTTFPNREPSREIYTHPFHDTHILPKVITGPDQQKDRTHRKAQTPQPISSYSHSQSSSASNIIMVTHHTNITIVSRQFM